MGNTLNYLQGLYDEYKRPELEINGTCHDCKKPVTILSVMYDDDTISVTGGAIYKVEGIETPFFKCESCQKTDSVLRNYRPCEVYSRVCGYLSPTNRYNKGKQAEFHQRTNFKM